MANATIVSAWNDQTYAYAAAAVQETQTVDTVSGAHTVEYLAKTPLRDNSGNLLSLAQLKTNLTAALSAARAAQLPANTSALAISGNVAI
jgi:hypothetical protein